MASEEQDREAETETPSFEEAAEGLRGLLESRGQSRAIAWIRVGDLSRTADGPVVTLDPEDDGEAWARAAYDAAMARGLGVVLEAVCTIGEKTGVLVYGPRDQQEAERLMMGNLIRIAVPARLAPAAVRWPAC